MPHSKLIRENIKAVLGKTAHWAEVRYHRKTGHVMSVLKGEVSEMSSKHYEGVGLRCLINGTWGFASTGDKSIEGLTKALKKAEEMARELASRRKKKITVAPCRNLGRRFLFSRV